jgi:pilus assembly protein CpaB
LKRSNRLMLTLGVLLAVVAFGGVLLFGSSPSNGDPSKSAPAKVSVVVAAVDVPLGTVLDATYLTTIEVATADATDTYRDATQLTGKITRLAVTQGEPFTAADFASTVTTSGADVASALKAGERAMAISVDSVSGVGSLIQAGDYVDVLMAIADQPEPPKAPVIVEFKDTSGLPYSAVPHDIINETTIKVLVQNVQVLGIVTPPPDPSASSTSTDASTGAPVSDIRTVIIGVTPQQAELVRFAMLDGSLSLVMRSPLDAAAPDVVTTGVTLRELVDAHGVLAPQLIISKFP